MKKLIALLLCLAMLLSLCSVAMAAPKTVSLTDVARTAIVMKKLANSRIHDAVYRYTHGIRYVALGDSTSVGFFLGGTDEKTMYQYSYQHNNGYPVSGEYSEYKLFMDYLQNTYKLTNAAGNIQGKDLTLTGMRPIYLRGILDKCEYNKLNSRSTATSLYDGDYMSHMGPDGQGEYITPIDPDSDSWSWAQNGYDGWEDIHNTYTAALKWANLITYDMFMLDTTSMLTSVMSVMSAGEPTHKFADLMAAEDRFSAISIGANALKVALEAVLKSSGANPALASVNNLVDSMLYTYANLCINFSKNVEWIYNAHLLKMDVNNVTMIVITPANCLPPINLDIKGVSVNMNRLFDCLIDAVNAYLVNGAPHSDWYYLADTSNAVETCLEAYANGVLENQSGPNDAYGQIWQRVKENIDAEAKSALTDDDYAQIRKNITTSCKSIFDTPLDIAAVLAMFDENSDADVDANRALYAGVNVQIGDKHINYSSATPTSLDQLALALTMAADMTIGIHPSAQCCLDKADAIKAAYESCRPARDFYQTQRINFVRNSVGAVLGNQKSQAAVSNTLTKLFTPIVDLSGLLKKAG